MFSPLAAIVALSFFARSGGEMRVPVQIAVTNDGADTSTLSATLRDRIRETYGLEPAEAPSNEPSHFHIHVEKGSANNLAVQVGEGESLIAMRELNEESETWLFIKATIRRALLAPALPPPRRAVRPLVPKDELRDSSPNNSVRGHVALRDGWSLRAFGIIDIGLGVSGTGAGVGIGRQIDVSRIPWVSGIELGYGYAAPYGGTVRMQRVPLTLLSGFGLGRDAPVVIGACATIEWVRVRANLHDHTGFTARLGAMARGRFAVFNSFDLTADLRIQVPFQRIRYQLTDISSVEDGRLAFGFGGGVEWRWR